MYDIRWGLGVGAFFSLISIGLGALAWKFGLRKSPVYYFEVLMFVLFITLFGLCFPSEPDGSPSSLEWTLQNNLNFIVLSVLAGLAIASLVLMQPFTLVYIQETVPKHHWVQPEVRHMLLCFFLSVLLTLMNCICPSLFFAGGPCRFPFDNAVDPIALCFHLDISGETTRTPGSSVS